MAIVLGYHGCSKETARQLLSGRSFESSNNSYDWLGAGAYFWEEDILRAYQWALERRRASPCVVGAVIELGHCLDLTKQAGIQAIKTAHTSYLELQRRTNQPVPENLPARNTSPGDLVLRHLDRAVVDHLHSMYASASKHPLANVSEFDTVRALFPEGERLYDEAGFRDKTHVQITVREAKQTQILGVFRVPSFQLRELKIPSLYDF